MAKINPIATVVSGISIVLMIWVFSMIINALGQAPGMPSQGHEILNQTQQGINNFATLYFGMPSWEVILLFIEVISIVSISIGFWAKKSRDKRNLNWSGNFA